MEKFLKLLDPRKVVMQQPGSIAQQAHAAREEFPRMVRRSNLHYWRLGDPILTEGTRFLIGLAVTFSLYDLRFADIVNEALSKPPNNAKRVDVFDILDCQTWDELNGYFGETPIPFLGWGTHPIVGIWQDGVFQRKLIGHEGMDHVLRDLGASVSVEEIVTSVNPPAPGLFED